MVAMLIYDRDDRELAQLKTICKDLFALVSEEELELNCISEKSILIRNMEKCRLMDLVCIKAAGREDIELLRFVRKTYEQAEVFIIADKEISPMEYLTPDIRAASLLLAPFGLQECRQIMKTFFHSFFQARDKADEKKVFVIANRDGKITIPYVQIYYIEIRERKVFIRLWDREYSLYDSLEHILDKLPENFMRCHRSYVFNTQHLDSVRLSENMVYLEHGITVPLSRSYKPAVKEFINGLRE